MGNRGGILRWAGLLALAMLAGAATATAQPRACGGESEARNAFFRGGEVDLAGEWMVPAGTGPFPALVILQGSGSSDRSNAWAAGIAEHLASCGVAVLLTDKRGAGSSSGDWRTATMRDLATDGVAALAWVGRQAGIDRDRLGFLGLSQGGRVAPEAAALSPEADFVISLVGGVGPMWDDMTASLDLAYRRVGLNEAQIASLRRLDRAGRRYVTTGRGWSEYLRLYREIAAGPLARATFTWPDYRSHWYWTFWRRNHGHDARP